MAPGCQQVSGTLETGWTEDDDRGLKGMAGIDAVVDEAGVGLQGFTLVRIDVLFSSGMYVHFGRSLSNLERARACRISEGLAGEVLVEDNSVPALLHNHAAEAPV